MNPRVKTVNRRLMVMLLRESWKRFRAVQTASEWGIYERDCAVNQAWGVINLAIMVDITTPSEHIKLVKWVGNWRNICNITRLIENDRREYVNAL
jgi:hypothetical protein